MSAATLAAVLAILAAAAISYERARPTVKELVPTATLAALAAAGRILFAAFPSFKPVSAIAIIAGATFGRRAGFMVGALAALVSNFYFGQGAWTPWQMLAWGLIGWLAGALNRNGALDRHPAALYAFGFASGLLYGAILDSFYVLGYISPLTVATALAAYAAGVPFNLTHATATVAFLAALHTPWRKKLQRIKQKFF